ncbi:MAG: uracil-DNA glycosylase, partial [Gaiellaceae bacterium]|nr:uracil-DNA glycosylase [Gaiellaceae bacterium]
EQELCSFWREWEFRLLRPRLVVPIGGVAIKRLLGRSGLAGCVGRRYALEGAGPDAVAVPLPHPSGASGWLNSPANRALVDEAATVIHEELARLEGAEPAQAASASGT